MSIFKKLLSKVYPASKDRETLQRELGIRLSPNSVSQPALPEGASS